MGKWKPKRFLLTILILLRNDLDDENRQNGDDDEVIWRRQGSKGGRQFTFSACDSPSPPPPPAPTPTPPTPAAAAAGPLPFSTALAKMCRASAMAAAGPLLHVCVLALLHIYQFRLHKWTTRIHVRILERHFFLHLTQICI